MTEDALYTRGRSLASRKLAQYKQGVIVYAHPATPSGTAYNPTIPAPTLYTLDAVASGVDKKYVDGKLVVMSDKQIKAAVFGITPVVNGYITVDSIRMEIIQIRAIPSAGDPLIWVFIVRS